MVHTLFKLFCFRLLNCHSDIKIRFNIMTKIYKHEKCCDLFTIWDNIFTNTKVLHNIRYCLKMNIIFVPFFRKRPCQYHINIKEELISRRGEL